MSDREYYGCRSCHKKKHIDCYYRVKSTKLGITRVCKDCLKKKRRKYIKKNRQKHNERCLNYYKERIKRDDLFRLSRGLRTNISDAIRRKDFSKDSTTRDIIGVDFNTFKKHIESKFTDGMSWDNWGRYGWHFDHIIPVSSAKTKEDLIKLNHYTNFQPLWWYDNLKKSNSLNYNK